MKKKFLINSIAALIAAFFAARFLARHRIEPDNIDFKNPYIKGCVGNRANTREQVHSFYEKYMKRCFDVVLSFFGLVFLSPLFIIIGIAVFVSDPGPVFFTQKRVGKDGTYFMLHKFRSMKMSTPHDIPTHQLSDPEKYITWVGRWLRKASLDELPQIWDIFRGRMSIIGPRPALWNQTDLVAERQKYNANSATPGLTGLAQISGRDELEIPVKARLDGEYVAALRSSSAAGILMDMRCFFGTIACVLKSDGVVEGGTGRLSYSGGIKQKGSHISEGQKYELRPGVPKFDPPTDWGFMKNFSVEKNRNVRVLITGAGSYIGTSFENYAKKHYPNIEIDTVDMLDGKWRNYDFSSYECVYHVAGIAHSDVGHSTLAEKERYYAINTDLAIECARKARSAGVRQFIFMSSMIIYGGRKYIDSITAPSPSNFYGDSKWQADKGVRSLSSPDFAVAVLRPPMIYGWNSKGNYPILAKLARKLPIFPNVSNTRSVLYIENLCELLCGLILSGEGGIYVPQNSTYTNTAEMVQAISTVAGKKIWRLGILNPFVRITQKIPGKIGSLANKAFGSSYYAQSLSVYNGLDYQLVSFTESIERTEGDNTASKITESSSQGRFLDDCHSGTCGAVEDKSHKKALMLASVASMIDLFNADNINILEELGYSIDVASNFEFGSITSQERVDAYKQELIIRGIRVYHIPIPRKLDIKLLIKSYRKIRELVEHEHYDIVHCHSPIGGVLCRLACRKIRKKGTKVIYTAHGFHFYKGAPKKAWMLYYPIEKACAKYTDVLITINQEDYRIGKTLRAKKTVYVPGIGIHADEFVLPALGTDAYEQMVEMRKAKRAEIGFTDDDFVFMSTGQISIRKNHEVIIRAIGEIAKTANAANAVQNSVDSHIKYLIVGFGEEEERLKKLCTELEVCDRIFFAGYRSDIKELLKAVDAFVFPSLQEGLPVALMEAMASGLPVVCSKIRGNVDLIEDGIGGYLVEPDDVNGFKIAMERITEMDITSMRTANLQTITSFDSSRINKIMIGVYEDALCHQ